MTITNGSFILYKILHAYNMLDMNVAGLTLLAMSITYTITVANDDAYQIRWKGEYKINKLDLTKVSVKMVPDADQVKTSIWPGVSNMKYLEIIEYKYLTQNVIIK